jgi:hypothetical protein
MERFQVAHIREQGQDLVIVVVNTSVHHKSDSEKAEILATLQRASISAGLAGTAVLAWESNGILNVYCNFAFHAFFRSITYEAVLASINKTLSVAA